MQVHFPRLEHDLARLDPCAVQDVVNHGWQVLVGAGDLAQPVGLQRSVADGRSK
jgi:1,2-phenylacetyl-CoA epoxidase catalytic subunit